MKKLLSLTLALSLFLSLAACGGKQATSGSAAPPADGSAPSAAEKAEATGDEIIINIYDWDSGFDTTVIDRFNEANPGIKAVFNTVPDNGDAVTKLDILAMGGGEVDVFPLADGDQFLRMQNGLLAPIDEFLAADGVDMEKSYGAHAEWCKFGDSYYGLPLRVNIEGVFFNKDMFDEAGIAYPDENWTLDEYVEIARKLTKGEGPNKVYGTYTHVWSGTWNYFGSQVASYYTEDGKCNFAADPIVKSLELRKKLDDEGIQQSFNQINAVQAMPNSAFLGAQNAMGPVGSWLIRDMKDQERFPHDFNIGWNYMPRFDDSVGKKAVNTSVSMLGIPETSKNKEAAWKFMRFYIEECPDSIAASGNIPCYLPAYSDELINVYIEGSGLDIEYARKIFASDITASATKVGAPPDTYATGPQYDQIMNEQTQLYFNGEQDLDTTVKNVVEQVDEVIAAA